MQAVGDLAAGLDGVLLQQRADQFLVAFLAGAQDFNPDKLGMELLAP